MSLALNLAKDRIGLTGENPSVGCVIVKNNEVISIGQTGINGRPHAEYNAIKSCKKNLDGVKAHSPFYFYHFFSHAKKNYFRRSILEF